MPNSQGIDGLAHTSGITNPDETTSSESAKSTTVKVNSQQVTYVPDETSLFQDSLEESTVLFQEKASTTLSKRDAKTRDSSKLEEILKKYLQNLQGVGQTEKFQSLIDSLKKKGKMTSGQIREELAKFLKDSGGNASESGLLLALEEVLVAEGGNDELLAAVREAKSNLGTELQDFYNKQVKDYGSINDVYKELLGDHDEKEFLEATNSMIHQLGSELQNQGTNADKNRTKSIVDSLYNLEVAKNLFTGCHSLLEKLKTEYGVTLAA